MPASGFFAVLRDVTKLAATLADDVTFHAKNVAASVDDVASLVGKATSKTAGVAADDLVVGASQVGTGIAPSQELGVLWRITKGSLVNKAVLTVGIVLVSLYFPWLLTAALFLGALYLSYEAVHEIWERVFGHDDSPLDSPELSVDDKVRGAIRTDFILSLEILVLAMAVMEGAAMELKIAALVFVGLVMTVLVYGLVMLLVRLDDIGLALQRSNKGWARYFGRGILRAVPVILKALKPVGVAVMLVVGGGMLSHVLHLPGVANVPSPVFDALVGVVAGGAVMFVLSAASKIWGLLKSLR